MKVTILDFYVCDMCDIIDITPNNDLGGADCIQCGEEMVLARFIRVMPNAKNKEDLDNEFTALTYNITESEG